MGKCRYCGHTVSGLGRCPGCGSVAPRIGVPAYLVIVAIMFVVFWWILYNIFP